jgi:hypothetical protein
MKRATIVALGSLAVLGALALLPNVLAQQPADRQVAAEQPAEPQPSRVVSNDGVSAPEQEVLVVDGSDEGASDRNPGTPARPLRTVGRAASLAAANNLRGVGTRIQIRPGTYRESVMLGAWRGQTPAPISFVGPLGGKAVISGSDVWTGWTRVGDTDLYRHAWPYRWGLSPLPAGWTEARIPDVVRRRELVFADGRLLRQVLDMADLTRIPGGGFAVDEANGLVTIRLPAGQEIDRTRIEVATRDQLLNISGRTNVQVSNLTFQHAASPLQRAAVRVERSSDVEIGNAEFVWNNWTGLGLNDDRDVTIRRSKFDANGSMGFSALRVKTLRLERTSNSYNTWRGHWGGWYGWENGMKLIGVHGAVLQHHTAVGNHSYGLWLDTDNRDVTVRDTRICNNRLAGVFLEASQGPITLDRTTVCRNGVRGILAGNASGVTVTDSLIANNGHAQIVLSGVQSGRQVTDWESRERLNVLSTHWTVERNRIQAGNNQLLVDNTWSAATWAHARPNYRWNGNVWTSAADRPFRLLGTYRLGTFPNWRAHTGLDEGSVHAPTPAPPQATR